MSPQGTRTIHKALTHIHVSTGKLPGNNFYDIWQNHYILYTVRLDKKNIDGDIRQTVISNCDEN